MVRMGGHFATCVHPATVCRVDLKIDFSKGSYTRVQLLMVDESKRKSIAASDDATDPFVVARVANESVAVVVAAAIKEDAVECAAQACLLKLTHSADRRSSSNSVALLLSIAGDVDDVTEHCVYFFDHDISWLLRLVVSI